MSSYFETPTCKLFQAFQSYDTKEVLQILKDHPDFWPTKHVMNGANFYGIDTWDQKKTALKALLSRIAEKQDQQREFLDLMSKQTPEQQEWVNQLAKQTPEEGGQEIADEMLTDPESALAKLDIVLNIAKIQGHAV